MNTFTSKQRVAQALRIWYDSGFIHGSRFNETEAELLMSAVRLLNAPETPDGAIWIQVREGMTLGEIGGLIDAANEKRVAPKAAATTETPATLTEDQFAQTAARYEKSLNELHRKIEELEREVCGLIRKNARLTRDSALKTNGGRE